MLLYEKIINTQYKNTYIIMKGSAIVYGRHIWETLAQMKDDIYNEIQLKEMTKDPEYI